MQEISRLPPHSAIFYQQMAVDSTGAVYADKEPWKRIGEVANAPIFSHDETYFTGELVGGPMWSPAEGARPTAAVAVRILGGEKASDIKVPPIEFPPPKYDSATTSTVENQRESPAAGEQSCFEDPTYGSLSAGNSGSRRRALLQGADLCPATNVIVVRSTEVQARQRMAELAHVNRFSTAGELTASIAHEINQPLGAILANAETAQAILEFQNPYIAALPDIVELRDIVSDILHDDRRATEVIRRMRSLLQKAPFELKSFDLNDLVRDTVKFLSSLAVGRKVELTNLLTQNALPILGDRIQLQQVILNLVVNGIDAMKDTPTKTASSASGLRAPKSLPSYPYWIEVRAFPKTN